MGKLKFLRIPHFALIIVLQLVSCGGLPAQGFQLQVPVLDEQGALQEYFPQAKSIDSFSLGGVRQAAAKEKRLGKKQGKNIKEAQKILGDALSSPRPLRTAKECIKSKESGAGIFGVAFVVIAVLLALLAKAVEKGSPKLGGFLLTLAGIFMVIGLILLISQMGW